MSLDQAFLTLIDFSFDQNNVNQIKLLGKFKTLRKHRKKVFDQVEIFRKYKRINHELRNDEEYCLKVVQIEGTILRKLKFQNRKIALAAIQQTADCYVYLKKEFKQDLEILEEIINSGSNRITGGLFLDFDSFTNMSIDDKIYLARKILNKFQHCCYSFPKCLLGEKDFILEIASQLCVLPPLLVSQFNGDKNFILEVLRNFKYSLNSYFIQSLSPELRNDMDIIKEIVKRTPESSELLRTKLKIFETVEKDYNNSKRFSILD